MQIIKSIDELQSIRKLFVTNPEIGERTVGFIPTMGALHDGHISLIKNARINNDIVIVSIFVNPTQFSQDEDFDKYPKKDKADMKICELCGVDYIFMPTTSMMYQGSDEVLIKAPKISSYILEGEKRPGHFDGVLQVVLKLFNLIQPTDVYFGKKDAQQLFLVSKMIKDLFLAINIVECEIVREQDGLALSSRNIYLSKQERVDALKISKSLKIAAELIGSDELDSKVIIKKMKKIMEGLDIEYIAIVDRSFSNLDTVSLGNTIILVATKVGRPRLLDNIWI